MKLTAKIKEWCLSRFNLTQTKYVNVIVEEYEKDALQLINEIEYLKPFKDMVFKGYKEGSFEAYGRMFVKSHHSNTQKRGKCGKFA